MNPSTDALPRTLASLRAGISDGLQLGAQLYVSKDGETIADWSLGESRVGVPMRPDSILLWLSSGKPLTAVAIARLWEADRLQLDDSVATFIPEFAQGGKQAVSVRHLLTHTCDLRTADKCDAGMEWSEIIACVCDAPLEPHWIPGQRAGYQPSASWYLLGEILRRIDGRPLDAYLHQEVLTPCGMRHSWLALPEQEFERYGQQLGLMYHTDKGHASPHRKWNTPTDAAVCRPGRNARGPIRELGFFYERLLATRAGRKSSSRSVLAPETVRQMTTRQRTGMFDDTFQQVIDWGLGFALDSKRYGHPLVSYGFGRYASEETFGHGGSQSSCGFADPAHGLVVAWAVNGLPGERRHQHRAHELNSAIYVDLKLGA